MFNYEEYIPYPYLISQPLQGYAGASHGYFYISAWVGAGAELIATSCAVPRGSQGDPARRGRGTLRERLHHRRSPHKGLRLHGTWYPCPVPFLLWLPDLGRTCRVPNEYPLWLCGLCCIRIRKSHAGVPAIDYGAVWTWLWMIRL